MKRCAVQNKKKYRSRFDAIMAQQNRPWWNRMRAYKCPHCGFWHTTRRYGS